MLTMDRADEDTEDQPTIDKRTSGRDYVLAALLCLVCMALVGLLFVATTRPPRPATVQPAAAAHSVAVETAGTVPGAPASWHAPTTCTGLAAAAQWLLDNAGNGAPASPVDMDHVLWFEYGQAWARLGCVHVGR